MLIHQPSPKSISRTGIRFLAICMLILVSFLIWGRHEEDFAQHLLALTAHPTQYAVWSYVVLSSDILLPIPNSIIMYANGFALGTWAGAGLSVISLMTTAVIGYYLGKLSAQGKWAAPDVKAQNFWGKYGELTILITRAIPILSESVCILAGNLRMPFRRYLWMNLLGYIPVSLLFALLGRYGYDQNAFLFSLACSFGIAALFWWLGKRMY
jgi:uncharacterized membrane protein YdjX (TVP38/TMEM64 family)